MSKKEKILITGGAGFIGTHLTRALLQLGYRVRVLDNFSPQVHGPHGREEAEIFQIRSSELEVLEGDVRSEADLRTALEGIDAVYHYAAAVGVGQSMYEIRSYTDTNNLGTANLLQLLIERPVQKLIVASSMSLYGEGLYRGEQSQRLYSSVRRSTESLQKRQWDPVDPESLERLVPIPTPEEKAPELSSIYALSKFDQERMCLLIGKAYRIPTVALRFFNVYGPGQALSNPYTGVMAIFASQLLNNNRPGIFEDGLQKRDFVHVTDIVQASILSLERSDADQVALNIGSGNQYTIRQIAQELALVLGKDIEPEITNKYRVGDIRHCFSDIELAKKVLGYQARISLSDGLHELTDWLKTKEAVDRTIEARQELLSRGLAL